MARKILGLDLGTNSIGWAVANTSTDETGKENLSEISAAGSRIIPIDDAVLGKFDSGESVSQTAQRTDFRKSRRLRERCLLRRERLHRILNLLEFLPEHFAQELDRYGKFVANAEPKLPWRKNADGKFEFIFQHSFNEMLADFQKHHPELLENGKKIPYDWTIYYLRKKALSQAITKEELAWILLNFNQKRGYYQLRGEEEEEKSNERVEIIRAKILSVVQKEKDKQYDKYWYEMSLDNGLTYRAAFYNDVSAWCNETKEFVLKTTTLKDGSEKTELSFLPTPDEIEKLDAKRKGKMYAKIKLRTEKDIDDSHKTVGCYIYDALLANPNQKINGKLVRTIERKYYREELKQILTKQAELLPDLQNEDLYKACTEELYPNNEAHRNNITKPDFVNLFINDIIFYQRPLKTKKSLISDCPYESHFDKEGNERPIKCIAKSNPLYQEFRLWQFVQNLRIYQREKMVSDGQLGLFEEYSSGKLQTDVDVTDELLKNEDDYTNLFDWLNDRGSIKQDTLLSSYFKIKKAKGQEQYPYRWNYVEDKEYPCNETRAAILSGLKKCESNAILDEEGKKKLKELWHILYSIDDKNELGKALKKWATKNKLSDPEKFVEAFAKIKPFKKEYGAYSEKAINKLLPLMRMGKYWKLDSIDPKTKERIDKIITGEYDENIKDRVREKAIELTDIEHFRGLPLWLACYVVYDRHSEAKEIAKWEKPEDIDAYLKAFKQHSLRNPIVEQVITETLRTVRDIWKQEGHIDEIHLELGREMKNPADKRKKMTENIAKNENTNLRIKAMLMEFMSPEMGIENVRPYSPSQQDILRIYEENALENLSKDDKEYDFVSKISKTAQPSKSEIIRYKCWLEQKYHSPYTKKVIPLSKLFTPAYEIEHIIPQSRYFDDSFSNKVICEREVNLLKGSKLGYEFIKSHHGEKVQISQGEEVEILSVDEYEKFVKEHYAHNRTKMKKLLLTDIPDDFIARQLNDSRYISKVVKALLSNIVREKLPNGEYEPEATSKHLISVNGQITDRLKKDWGMNDVWNRIVLPRFERLNELTGKDCFTALNTEGHTIPNMPIELQKGFNKKRIDHRHHAMDAIVIACATRDHVNLLNNEAANSKNNANRYQLQCKLRRLEQTTINGEKKNIFKEFRKPWDTFTKDAYTALQDIVVSFKQNLRVINKTTNHYQHYDEKGKKVLFRQEKGDNLAIRKPMHKDTVFGEVNLRMKKCVSLDTALNNPKSIVEKELKKKILELLSENKDAKSIKKYFENNKDIWSDINTAKIEVYYFTKQTKERYFATRKDLVSIFSDAPNSQKAQDKIKSITDTGIQKILLAHLKAKDDNPELAFSPDGIDEMNRNIKSLNGGKNHQPILKARVYEKADKFAIGQTGNKSTKFVEAAKGTNLFFAIYESEKIDNKGISAKSRSYATIPLNMVIDSQKKAGKHWKNDVDEKLKANGTIDSTAHLLFMLSPNDLVYLPTDKELNGSVDVAAIDKRRIYKMVSSSGNQCFFVTNHLAKTIVNKVEYSPLNKMERSISGEMIKEICLPLKVDRLGNIIEFNGKKL